MRQGLSSINYFPHARFTQKEEKEYFVLNLCLVLECMCGYPKPSYLVNHSSTGVMYTLPNLSKNIGLRCKENPYCTINGPGDSFGLIHVCSAFRTVACTIEKTQHPPGRRGVLAEAVSYMILQRCSGSRI